MLSPGLVSRFTDLCGGPPAPTGAADALIRAREGDGGGLVPGGYSCEVTCQRTSAPLPPPKGGQGVDGIAAAGADRHEWPRSRGAAGDEDTDRRGTSSRPLDTPPVRNHGDDGVFDDPPWCPRLCALCRHGCRGCRGGAGVRSPGRPPHVLATGVHVGTPSAGCCASDRFDVVNAVGWGLFEASASGGSSAETPDCCTGSVALGRVLGRNLKLLPRDGSGANWTRRTHTSTEP